MQRSLCDVKHLRTVNTAIVINLLDDQSIGERRDVQHVEQRGLAGPNLVSSLDQTNITLGDRDRQWLLDAGSSFQILDFKVHIWTLAVREMLLCVNQGFFNSITVKLTKISMVPLEILVVIPKAWKKEVFSGPRPVFCAGTVTSQGAIAPARAAAGT